VSGMALLAAPWDFHTDNAAARAMMKAMEVPLGVMIGAEGKASVDLLQALFASLDPTLAGRKFRSFAALDPASEDARRFIELEDWLNDGVPLAAPVMTEVLGSWYGANDPARLAWRVSDTLIDPARVTCPTLALIPGQDRIVPPESARALATAIPGAVVRDVPFGHIGMVAGGSAPKRIYAPLIEWLRST
jgi:polyhydroxyalkanoate synthase subunit PhaC